MRSSSHIRRHSEQFCHSKAGEAAQYQRLCSATPSHSLYHRQCYPLNPPHLGFSSAQHAISGWESCFHQLPTCLHHIYISHPVRVWHRLKSNTPTPPHHPLPPPSFNTQHSLPQRTHSILLPWKGYPSAPQPNSSHDFWERSTRLSSPWPPKMARASPNSGGGKNATNYWGSRQPSPFFCLFSPLTSTAGRLSRC